MSDKPKSPRHLVADRLAAIVVEGSMASPYGGDVGLTTAPSTEGGPPGRPRYAIGFSRPRYLDGVVEVYSPKFIFVRADGRHAPNGHFEGVFESEENAAKFLRFMTQIDLQAAAEVPTKPPRQS